MLFIDNESTTLYFKIIENARQNPYNGFTESHHIIPKALGGDNSKENLVDLSAMDHWHVHKLLPNMTTGENRRKMLYAFGMFRVDKTGNRILTAKQYEESKLAFVEAHSKRTVTEETRTKLSITSRAIPVDHHCIHCNRVFNKGNFQQFHGDRCRKNPNVDLKDIEQRCKERTMTEESLMNLRESLKGRSTSTQCEYCNKVMDPGNYKISHGPKCKEEPGNKLKLEKESAKKLIEITEKRTCSHCTKLLNPKDNIIRHESVCLRNQQIKNDHFAGFSKHTLAEKYNVSIENIRYIISKW